MRFCSFAVLQFRELSSVFSVGCSMFGVILSQKTLNKACPDPSGEHRISNTEDDPTYSLIAYSLQPAA